MSEYKKWTKKEEQQLLDMVKNNIKYKDISVTLNKSISSIAGKMMRMQNDNAINGADIEWARNNFDKKGYCNKDFIYYSKRSNGNIDYVDLSDLPKKGRRINWLAIDNNEIKLFHENNFFIINAISGDIDKRIILKYNDKEAVFFIDSIKKVGCYSITKTKIIDLVYLHPYIKHLDTCSHLTPQSNKSIICHCPHCGIEKIMKIQWLYIQGFSCPICSKGSMGEKQSQAIMEASNLIIFEDYFPQKTFKGLVSKKGNLLKYDFYLPKYNILIEIQGGQHYKEVKGWGSFEEVVYKDNLKRKFAKDNGYRLIEIDARKGTLENIHKQFQKNFKFIKDNIEDIRRILHDVKNIRWDYKDISNSYSNGESMTSIGKRYDATSTTIRRILKEMGVYKQVQSSDQSVSKRIRCKTTGEIFPSISKACKEYNIQRGNLGKMLNGKIKYCGRHPITDEELYWELVD